MQHDFLFEPLCLLLENRKIFAKWNLVVFREAMVNNVSDWITIGLALEFANGDAIQRELYLKANLSSVKKVIKKHISYGDLLLNPDRYRRDVVKAIIFALDKGEIISPMKRNGEVV